MPAPGSRRPGKASGPALSAHPSSSPILRPKPGHAPKGIRAIEARLAIAGCGSSPRLESKDEDAPRDSRAGELRASGRTGGLLPCILARLIRRIHVPACHGNRRVNSAAAAWWFHVRTGPGRLVPFTTGGSVWPAPRRLRMSRRRPLWRDALSGRVRRCVSVRRERVRDQLSDSGVHYAIAAQHRTRRPDRAVGAFLQRLVVLGPVIPAGPNQRVCESLFVHSANMRAVAQEGARNCQGFGIG
jgi:hypothetical protein